MGCFVCVPPQPLYTSLESINYISALTPPPPFPMPIKSIFLPNRCFDGYFREMWHFQVEEVEMGLGAREEEKFD